MHKHTETKSLYVKTSLAINLILIKLFQVHNKEISTCI